eukprot:1131748_1
MVNSYYFQNFFIGNLYPSEVKCITYPKSEVQIHSTLRFAQIGAMIGFVLGEVIGLYRARKFKSGFGRTSALLSGQKSSNWMITCSLLSFPASYGYYKIKAYQYSDFYDRALRLRSNHYQLRIDRASLLGASLGGLLMLTKRKRVLDGIAMGMVNGLFFMTLYNVHIWRNQQKELFQQMQQTDSDLTFDHSVIQQNETD